MGTVSEAALRELVAAKAIKQVTVVGVDAGFVIAVRFGDAEKTLGATRGGKRMFASLDTASSFLSRLGLKVFEVDVEKYEKRRLRKARPDRAEALRRTRTKPRQQTLL